jgi:hypothetical protein
MSFAVVEYSSKSGDVWRHTPQRPNYLSDPSQEMDPTSFGCYVSAMQGIHVPLTRVIHASRFSYRLYRRLTGRWPVNYSLGLFSTVDHLLVVYEVANSQTILSFMRRVKKHYPKIKIIGVPTQPYGLLKMQWQENSAIISSLQSFISACDTFITIVKSTTDSWGEISDRPVVYLPQPYPVEYASALSKPLETKDPIIFIAGVAHRPQITLGHRLAAQLQRKFPDHVIHLTDTPDNDNDFSHLQGARYEIQPFLPWYQHLKYLSSVKLVINTDFTQTRGRVQMDCAAVGTPAIGADSDAQLDLFPHLAANPQTSWSDLTATATAILSSPDRYRRTVAYAAAKLPFYNYAQSALRLNKLYESIKK